VAGRQVRISSFPQYDTRSLRPDTSDHWHADLSYPETGEERGRKKEESELWAYLAISTFPLHHHN